MVFGVVIAYALALVFFGPMVHRVLFDSMGFGQANAGIVTEAQRHYVRLITAVLGAVLCGWMVTLVLLAVSRIGQWQLVRRAVVVGLVTWFSLDTGMSLSLGFIGHAAFNVPFLGVFLLALFWPARRET